MPEQQGDDVQLVVFRVGAQRFAVSVFEAERILRYREPTPLPKAPAFLEGVIAYGDSTIPLVDLRKRLAAPATVRDETRVIVLELERTRIGVVVDQVIEVCKVRAEEITLPPDLVRGLAAEFINGMVTIGGRTIVMLAVSRLLSSDEQVALAALTVEAGHE